ncbi:maintenance of telomere capping protein 1 [Phakopsora pachyrhizi]|nr:maintenance of telomere capping protein 1 [Phakopsora pachyrhizi]
MGCVVVATTASSNLSKNQHRHHQHLPPPPPPPQQQRVSTTDQQTNSSNKDPSTPASNKVTEAQSVLDFLDEITQRSITPTPSIQTKKLSSTNRPLSRKQSNSSIISSNSRPNINKTQLENNPLSSSSTIADPQTENTNTSSSTGWGWGSVLRQATSNVLSQAKSAAGQVQSVVVDHSKSRSELANYSNIIQNQITNPTEAAKKWKDGVLSYVKASGIDQLGKDLQASGIKSLNDIMNMVVPPISKHELIEVQLSYDMIGYDGIETLVYKTLSKVMEQVDGGDLILNKGDEEKPKPSSNEEGEEIRDLNAIDGLNEGYKLALANLEQMIMRRSKKEKIEREESSKVKNEETSAATTLPITNCPVYLRIQPILSPSPIFNNVNLTPKESKIEGGGGGSDEKKIRATSVDQESHLFFLVLLKDVNNCLDLTTLSQSMPTSWLDIPFEENEWVEDFMVDIIKKSVEIIGQQYINGRLSGRSIKNSNNEADNGGSKDDSGERSL